MAAAALLHLDGAIQLLSGHDPFIEQDLPKRPAPPAVDAAALPIHGGRRTIAGRRGARGLRRRRGRREAR
jgi:hypothetical protein